MKPWFKKLGFTLMEVNLAVFIMATGVLAMVSLYPLGYRESQQSVEDVKAAAYADALLNQITGALSARSLSWQDWVADVQAAINVTGASIGNKGGAWARFCNTSGGFAPRKKGEINSLSKQVFSALTAHSGRVGGSSSWPVDNDLTTALVAQWGVVPIELREKGAQYQEDRSRVTVSLRVARNAGSIFAQPLFLTEIHFQGDQEDKNATGK